MIDAKSPYTGGHSARVSLFADGIAERLGLDPASRRRLARSAALHDLGKLGVSSRILEKPGALDDGEWVQMRLHAALTTDILSRVGTFSDMAMIAGSHHERLDGKGYPLGLDASMIALETRIITVADFFDALTADRPYRSAMSIERALGIMAREVDIAIDPRCFAALQAVVEAGIPKRAGAADRQGAALGALQRLQRGDQHGIVGAFRVGPDRRFLATDLAPDGIIDPARQRARDAGHVDAGQRRNCLANDRILSQPQSVAQRGHHGIDQAAGHAPDAGSPSPPSARP